MRGSGATSRRPHFLPDRGDQCGDIAAVTLRSDALETRQHLVHLVPSLEHCQNNRFHSVEVPKRGRVALAGHSAQLVHLVRSANRPAGEQQHALAFKRLRLQRYLRARQERSCLEVFAFDRTSGGGEGEGGRYRVAECRLRMLRHQPFGVCGEHTEALPIALRSGIAPDTRGFSGEGLGPR